MIDLEPVTLTSGARNRPHPKSLILASALSSVGSSRDIFRPGPRFECQDVVLTESVQLAEPDQQRAPDGRVQKVGQAEDR